MINVDQRSLLTDALTPPAGYVFESGVATTFSLDLVTLLTLPLHLAWLGSAESQTGVIDPLPIFEALRRTSGRLSVFSHAGRLQIPRAASPLLSLMEGMVHEVLPRHGGVFHPKVWLLKFAGTTAAQAAKLRLLVLSRNLTDDRSWDLSMSLEGNIGRAKLASNLPLQKFLMHTQTLSRRPITPARQKDLLQLSDDAHRCVWDLPGGFDELRFHALGIERRPQPWLPQPDAGRWDELGVISPFVAADALAELAGLSVSPLFLVCRPDEMDKLTESSERRFQKTWVLDAQMDASDQEDEALGRLSGLHAKAFIGKRGWNTHLFVGSANATDAALLRGYNVEFMAELIGRYSQVRLPSDWLGEEGLGSVLVPYDRSIPSETEEELQATLLLEGLRERLIQADLHLACTVAEQGWTLALERRTALDLQGVLVRVWPLSIGPERAVEWTDGGEDRDLPLGSFAEQDLTSFVGFSLTSGEQELSFALNLPTEGMPEGRDLSILRAALSNREGFVRYLLLLLGNWEPQGGGEEGDSSGEGSWRAGAADSVPLFEMLARAFSRDPARLEQVGQVLEKLATDPGTDAEDIVPAEFREMWKSFQQAMKLDAVA